MTDPYASCPVDRTSREIRLLKLHPNNDEGVIKCDMQTYNHHDRPSYAPVSYTWGPEIVHTNIVINGALFPVRENLWDFLQQQRLHGNYGHFWIDALCIQQSEVQERNHQVRMMDSIYTQARAVFIWLGKERDGSDIAMQMLADWAWDYRYILPLAFHDIEDFGRHCWSQYGGQFEVDSSRPYSYHKKQSFRKYVTLEEARSILKLFQREYWSRMWIIQEVMLAHRLEIFCGTKILSEHRLRQFIKNRGEMCNPKNPYSFVPTHKEITSSPAWHIATMRSALEKPHEGTGFQRLLQTYGHHECEDIRDKVYALAGVWTYKSSLDIDYRKSAKEILVDVFYLECARMSWEGQWNRRSLLMIGVLLEKALNVPFSKPEVQFHLDCSRDIASENLVINGEKRSWTEFCEAVKLARGNASCSYGLQHSKFPSN